MRKNDIVIRILAASLCTVFFISCLSNKYSKEKHIRTWKVSNGLYAESFQTYTGNATTCDSYSYYITDSIHFRKFIGEENYDDEEIIWKIKDNTITTYKKLRNEDFKTFTFSYDSTQIGNYKIDELIKEGKFE